MADYADRLLDNLATLSSFLLSEERLDTTLERVATLACETVVGCDGCGVTLVSSSGPITAAASHESVLPVDRVQYDAGSGPCIAAYLERRIVRVDVMTDDDRWPVFASAAVEAGVHSSLSFPLVVRHEAIGALNLYSRKARAFPPEAERTGRVFAEQAAVAIANAGTHEAAVRLAANLEHALESRAVIDQAIGILIARHGGTAEDGFARLRSRSQHENVKLRDIAQRVVDDAARAHPNGELQQVE